MASNKYLLDEKEVRGYVQLHEEVGDTFHLMQDQMTGQTVPMAGKEHEGSIPSSTSHIDIASKMHLIEEGKILVNEIEITNIKQCVSVGDHMLYKAILPIEEYPIVPFMNEFNL